MNMGLLCLLLFMFLCVGWVLLAFVATMLVPVVTVYNGVVALLCFILYQFLKKKQFFTKYPEGWKRVLSMILKYAIILFGIGSFLICGILAFLLLS